MKNIVLTNIYGKYNLGDYAIRNSAIKLLHEISRKNKYHMLCESTKNFPLKKPSKIDLSFEYSPYGYALESQGLKKSILKKLVSFLDVVSRSLFISLLGKFNSKLMPDNGFFRYIQWISKAESVFLMGGGYLITKNKLTDLFGVILNVIPIYVAKFYNKKVIVLPISFGPFASGLHSFIIGNALKNTQLYCRDKISLKYARKYNANAQYMPDLALYDWDKYKKVERDKYYVLTVKDYLPKERQSKVEEEVSKYILYMWKKHKLRCIFIPTGANPIEENDIPVGKRIEQKINNHNIFSILIPPDPDETKRIIGKGVFAICTRMHSAIFSITEYTPFIAIAYEHKSIGLLNSLKLSKWYIKMSDVTESKLINMTSKLLNKSEYNQFINSLKIQREVIQSYRAKFKQELLGAL